MKVQIRHSVFETNSSSTHTISICPNKVDMTKYIGKTLNFGPFPEDGRYSWNTQYYKPENAIQRKCDEILSYMCYWNDLSVFMTCKKKLTDVFSKYDIKCEFHYDPNEGYYCEVENAMKILFDDDNETFEDDIIKFIFNAESDYESIDRDELYRNPEKFPGVTKYKTYKAGE